MYHSKLFDVLRTFDSEDWNRFYMFLKGQADDRSEVTRLYRFISSNKSNLDHERLSTDSALSRLFGNKTRKNFLNVMSRLLAILRDYLIWNSIRQNELLKRAQLVQEYNRRGLYDKADKLAFNWENLKGNVPTDLTDPIYELLTFHYQYFSDNPVKSQKGNFLLLKSWEAAQKVYKDFFLFYYIESFNISQLHQTPEQIAPILDRKADLLSLKPWNNPVLESLYELRINKNSKAYNYLYHSLLTGNNWSSSYKLIALLLCNWYITQEISKGDLSRAHQAFELFKFGLQEGFFLYQGQLSQVRFLNMVDYAVKLGYAHWAVKLIDEWSDVLPPATRVNDVLLAKSMIYFSEKKYDEVLKILTRMVNTNLQHRLRTRWISIKAYYELYGHQRKFMLDQIQNYNDFFSRNSDVISQRNIDGSLSLSHVIKGMINKVNPQELMDEYVTNKNINSTMWVKDKLEQEKLTGAR